MNQKLEVGAHVIFVDPNRVAHHALIEHVFLASGKTVDEHVATYGQPPCINVIYFSDNPEKTDQYGRQKERATSVVHAKSMGKPEGYYWKWEHEEI
jgi:hypothetical protein